MNTLLAGGVLCSIRIHAGDQSIRCSRCAAAGRIHSYAVNGFRGYFCPGCGMEIKTQLFWLSSHRRESRPVKPSALKTDLVPFPNPEWVRQTDKPLAQWKMPNE